MKKTARDAFNLFAKTLAVGAIGTAVGMAGYEGYRIAGETSHNLVRQINFIPPGLPGSNR